MSIFAVEHLLRSDETSRWSAKRLTVLVMLLLQVAAPALHAADLVLHAEEEQTPVHIESERGDDCAEPHHDALCQLVRSLVHFHGGTHTSRTMFAYTVTIEDAGPTVTPRVDRTHFGSTGSRAPPLG